MSTINHMRLASLGLAASLAATLAWGLLRAPAPRLVESRTVFVPTNRPPTPDMLAREQALVERRLGEARDYAEFAQKYRAAWPGDWTAMIEKIARRRLTGEQFDAPDAWFAEGLRELRRTRGLLAAKAGPQALSRVIETQASTLAALSVLDRGLCVDFLYGQPSKGFLDFAARHPGLMARMANAAIDAIADGQTSKVARAAPTDADFAQLEKALVAGGLSKVEIEALLDGRHPDPPIPDDRLCEAGIVYIDALKRMPEEPRLRLYALAVELMAKP